MLFEHKALGCAHCRCIVGHGSSRTGEFDAEESIAGGGVAGLVDCFVGACEVDEVDLVEGENYGAEGLEGGHCDVTYLYGAE